MKRMALMAIFAALLAACNGGGAFEDRSGEVWIKHRVPSK